MAVCAARSSTIFANFEARLLASESAIHAGNARWPPPRRQPEPTISNRQRLQQKPRRNPNAPHLKRLNVYCQAGDPRAPEKQWTSLIGARPMFRFRVCVFFRYDQRSPADERSRTKRAERKSTRLRADGRHLCALWFFWL